MKKKLNEAKDRAGLLFVKLRPGSRSRTPSPISQDPNPVPDTSAPSTSPLNHLELQPPPTFLQTTGSVVQEFLEAARDGSDLCLPLKAALVGATKILDICKRTSEVKEQYKNLASRIAQLGAVIGELSERRPVDENLIQQLKDIAEWLKRLTDSIEKKEARGVLRRVFESKADVDEVKDILSKISNLIVDFMFASQARVEIGMGEILARLPGTQEKELEKELKKWRDISRIIKNVLEVQRVADAAYEMQAKDAGCMPGTRRGVLAKFFDWVKHNPKGMLWLAGMAGTGKTSIAVSLCRMLEEDPETLLGGSFFCSRTVNMVARTDVRRILPTLASSLAKKSSEFASELATAELKPDVARGPVSDQILPLFLRPLVALAAETRPIVFVIDALDECGDERELEDLLSAITTLKTKANVKFILTSRPETSMLGSPVSDGAQSDFFQLHVIDKAEVTDDIHRYIAERFSKNRLAKSWYTEADVAALATLAGGLFIFASTIASYVLDAKSVVSRTTRLQKAVSAASESTVAMGPLDAVYEFVLTRASDMTKIEPHEREAMQRSLACILAARMPFSAEGLAELLGVDVDFLRESFLRLRAAVHVPEEDNEPGVQTLHATFGDYLFQRAPVELRLPASLGNETLARGCLDVMRDRLRFNVSECSTSYEQDPPSIPGSIPLALQYACLHWIYHISGIPEPSKLDQEISEVFLSGFLYWLEVMSVLGMVRRAAIMLHFAAATVKSVPLVKFFRDASSFVASSREAIEASPSHIYISALPFAAKDSVIYKTFHQLFTGLVFVTTNGIDRHGGRHLMTLTGHEAKVNSVAYSSDGRLLASGSDDGTVRVWDSRTGDETVPPLRSGDGLVHSVAFSPNGRSIASATQKGIVCIWSSSGESTTPRRLDGEMDSPFSLAFSPDGSLLAAATGERSVRIWSVETGRQISTIIGNSVKGQRGYLVAIAFSPDGKTIASSLTDRTVQLWHSVGGAPACIPLEGHLGRICGISFSQNGSRLASSCSRGNIMLWDPQTGTKITTINHDRSIESVEFSPDGRFLVSASSDSTVQLSNVADLKVDDTEFGVILKGHTSSVNSASFSPDGQHVASASDDGTIRIWDAVIGERVTQLPQKHEGVVSPIAISPDGAFVASGADDGAVCVWDISKADQRYQSDLLHTDRVRSVSTSPDGRLIASASEDCTVRLWDLSDGNPVGEALKGHEEGVTAVGFSPDSLLLASGSKDQTVLIWNVVSGQRSVEAPLEVRSGISAVAFSPNGQLLAASDQLGRINLWQTSTYKRSGYPLQVIPNRLTSMAFSRDSTRIVAGARDGEVFLWDLDKEQPTALTGHVTSVNTVAVSLDGRRICSGSKDGVIRVWDLRTQALLAVLHAHNNPIISLTFTPDGQSIVSSADDKTIRVWDVKATLSLSSKDKTNPIVAAAAAGLTEGWLFGPAGERLLWVPADYRSYLDISPCTRFIGAIRVRIATDYRGWHAGTNWTSCWRQGADKT